MIHVAVSIDTEADHQARSWVRTDPLTFRSITWAVPEILSPIFKETGARPTYLLAFEVLNDPASVETLRSLSDAEVGVHLHGDHVPPGADPALAAGTASMDLQCWYPEEVERTKLVTITDVFRDRTARPARSFRAGRYGASGRTVALLGTLGYVVDSSVTPGVLWAGERDPTHVLDFRQAPVAPYHPSPADLSTPGDLGVLEVPITVVPRPAWSDAGVMFAQRVLRRPIRRYPLFLRPSTASWPWLRWAIDRATATARAGGDAWLNVMFHSMEVVPGASPYSRTAREADRVAGRLRRILLLLRARGARFHTLTELADAFERAVCSP